MSRKTVEIPLDIFAKATNLEDLEDWLIVNDPESLAGLTEARKQHLCGETISLAEVKERLARKTSQS